MRAHEDLPEKIKDCRAQPWEDKRLQAELHMRLPVVGLTDWCFWL